VAFLTFLSAWYAWPFALALLIATLLFAVEIIFGGMSDFGIDIGDLDMDLDVDTDFDFDMPHFLSWLGMGKVPVSILIEMTLFFFGATGLIIMSFASTMLGPAAALGLVVAVPASIAVTVFTTNFLAVQIANVIPQHSTTSKFASEYVGSVGRTLSLVEDSFGQVSVSGAVLNARTSEGTIARGTEVVLVSYDSGGHFYIVEAHFITAKNK